MSVSDVAVDIVDAAIVQDVGICRLIRHLSPDFLIHASTQMTVTSGVGFAKRLGCDLVVLARECSLKEINKIQRSWQRRRFRCRWRRLCMGRCAWRIRGSV